MTAKQNQTSKASHTRQNERTTLKRETALSSTKKQQGNIGQRLGEETAYVLDTKNRPVNRRKQVKRRIQATPIHVKYTLH